MSTANIAQLTKRLFVGNLPWTIGSLELKEYFSAFGHVSSASVVFDKISGMSRGYGFVTFSLKEGYQDVSKQKIHAVEGKVITIEPAEQIK